MTTTPITLAAEPRTALGHKNRALRRGGFTPLHVYGHGEPSLALQCATPDAAHVLAFTRATAPLTLQVAGGDDLFVMVREVQRHPVTDELVHIDFIRISRTERVRAHVPVRLEGEAPGARAAGATLVQDLHEVEVEALPLEIPSDFTVDVSGLESSADAVHVSDLAAPARVTILTDPGALIVRIVQQRPEALEEAEAEPEPAEAEAAAEAAPEEESAEA
ncbi:MAG: 50S ribosomal protein L25 [Chloroflexota bacterium]|nr:50S ribosomal protein L25 [Chloroflexota bacterium]